MKHRRSDLDPRRQSTARDDNSWRYQLTANVAPVSVSLSVHSRSRVCGLLVERRPGKSGSARVRSFLRNVRQWDFLRYAAGRIASGARDQLDTLGASLLHLVHGGAPTPLPDLPGCWRRRRPTEERSPSSERSPR